jgi:hypothetical protein
MRDLEFFETKAEYEDHIWSSVFTQPWVRECEFYRKLVAFIIDHRAPIFYTVSDKDEHFAFSGAYYFETRRQRYPDATREQLFWLHDFTHMLFPYAHDVYEISGKDFLHQFWYQERIASTETEIMAYYRVPGLRERVFPDEKLWYDVIRERGWSNPNDGFTIKGEFQPHPGLFLKYRERVQLDDEFGQKELGDHPEILKFVTSWRKLTPRWVNKRYASVAGLRIETYPYDQQFDADNYEYRILAYDEENRPGEQQYRDLIMANVRMAYDLLQWDGKPVRWRHIPEAIDRLEGAVLLR